MDKIKNIIFGTKEFSEFTEKIPLLTSNSPLYIHGAAGSLISFVAVRVFERTQRHLLVIASDEERAEQLRDDCALLVGEHAVRLFGARPTHQTQALDVTASLTQSETLKALHDHDTQLVVASPKSIVEAVPSPKRFCSAIIELQSGGEFPFQQLIDRLAELGFERKDFVEGYGDFAVRGGILDVFPYIGENPVRCEFWGDTIESIREFDALSQRSIRTLKAASIIPSLSSDIETNEGTPTSSLFEYLHHDSIILLDEPSLIEQEITELHKEGVPGLFSYEEFVKYVEGFPRVLIQKLKAMQPETAIDLLSIAQPSFNGSVSALVQQLQKLTVDGYTIVLASDTKEESKRLEDLVEEVITQPEERVESNIQYRTSNIKVQNGFAENDEIDPHTNEIAVQYSTGSVHAGFVYPSAKLAVFTEHEIFGRLKRRGTGRKKRFKGFTQRELHQLKYGDAVVHVDHGIGTFAGLKKIKVGDVEQDVVKLLFLENDILYVNLNYVNRVQKYSSSEGHTPALSKLGSADWERIKSRAKKRIKDIARELIALYALRKKERGFAFAPDSHWQKELEASFMYEDTPDQARSTLEVKQDMESSSPMDRLICGDVGFGKTEVALRAAFKAVLSGKQVAVLVPTTILALQHYNTFRDRLAKYSVRVDVLNRFRSAKDQKQIAEGLKAGTVDIVIGTHRLLSKDIGFKDVGLLIIDEEHRFGVTAKEKLRQFKATVDTLTLTATPIPRTLHFSLIGARDLSIIATPPRNRLPIQTEIVPADPRGRKAEWQIVREAIIAELRRGGQIYVVHDRVQNIDAIADQVRSHVPEARVHVAHGQMAGHELEKTMVDFLEKKYDVLVCTKIIESGLDIPNANTIIVNRADRFGMAELYQLRGRVGRSNVQAYAYLLTPPLSVLPKHSLKRLQAIEEFTELGSGFNLAMRDLEIRGAGNLLGAEQSGFIMEMGFEMYERIMREAVDELKQQEFNELFDSRRQTSNIQHPALAECVIDTDIEAFIPNIYIESDAERLDIYRRLYKALTNEELNTLHEELRDRFGEYPEEVEHLFGVIELRQRAARAGLPKISLKGSLLTMTLPDQSSVQFYGTDEAPDSPFQKIMAVVSRSDKKSVKLQQTGKELTLQCMLPASNDSKERLSQAMKKLEEFLM